MISVCIRSVFIPRMDASMILGQVGCDLILEVVFFKKNNYLINMHVCHNGTYIPYIYSYLKGLWLDIYSNSTSFFQIFLGIRLHVTPRRSLVQLVRHMRPTDLFNGRVMLYNLCFWNPIVARSLIRNQEGVTE